MTSASLLYQPRESWRVATAFAAAFLIHFAAIALANVQGVEKTGGPPLTDVFSDITFEEPPVTVPDPAPENPDPLPTPPRTAESVPEERSTPPPIRRATGKPIAPIVKLRKGFSNPGPWSSAKALAVHSPRPEYPYEARRQKITGEGIVAMTVDPVTGSVSGVSITKSTGNPFLDNAALTAFRRWRFKPGTVSAVACPITFTLVGASY